jgi:poly-beta-1,6-N-acetyl-D-glucosamine synthase
LRRKFRPWSGVLPVMDARILVVSPVRNEAPHIESVVRAMAAQEHPPARWIVVDDGSTDGTLDLLRALEPELPFMRVMSSPPDERTNGARDRLARAAAPRNFNAGLSTAHLRDYTHVMKLDGDVELPADYFVKLLARFAEQPKLGMACGDLVEPDGDGFRRLAIPAHHVHGALKCYTVDCFEAIGGVQELLGWDTIDETYARMRGYLTRSFPDIVAVHHRPLGSADGTLRGRARHGECAYIAHFGFVWVALRSLKIARSRPFGASGAAFLYSWVRAAVLRTSRVPDPDFRRFARRELRGRMIRGVLRRRPPAPEAG